MDELMDELIAELMKRPDMIAFSKISEANLGQPATMIAQLFAIFRTLLISDEGIARFRNLTDAEIIAFADRLSTNQEL